MFEKITFMGALEKRHQMNCETCCHHLANLSDCISILSRVVRYICIRIENNFLVIYTGNYQAVLTRAKQLELSTNPTLPLKTMHKTPPYYPLNLEPLLLCKNLPELRSN